jgi:hypothetical protein
VGIEDVEPGADRLLERGRRRIVGRERHGHGGKEHQQSEEEAGHGSTVRECNADRLLTVREPER